MNYTVVWSAEAEAIYTDILTFLEEHWTEKQALRFIERTEEVIGLIEANPMMYPRSSTKGVHRAVLGKQISLYYPLTQAVQYGFSLGNKNPLFPLARI